MDHAAAASSEHNEALAAQVPDVYGSLYGPYEDDEEEEAQEAAKKKKTSKKHKHKKSSAEQHHEEGNHEDGKKTKDRHGQDEVRKKKKKKHRTPEEEFLREAARRKRLSSKYPDAPIDPPTTTTTQQKSSSSRRGRSHDPGLPSQSVTPPPRRMQDKDDQIVRIGTMTFPASGQRDLPPQEIDAAFGLTSTSQSLQPVSWDPSFDFQQEVNWGTSDDGGGGLAWPDDNDVSVITPLTAFDEEPTLPDEDPVVDQDDPFVPVTTQVSGSSSGGKSMSQWQLSTNNRRGVSSRPGAHRVTPKYQAPVSSYSQHYRRTSAPQSRIRSQTTGLSSEKRRNTLPPGLYPIAESFEPQDKKSDKKHENGPLSLFPVDESYEGGMAEPKQKNQQRLSYSSTGESYAQFEADSAAPGGFYVATRRSTGKGGRRRSSKEDEGGGPSYFQSSEQYGDDNLVEDPSAQSARANESGTVEDQRLGAFAVRRMGAHTDSELGTLSDHPDDDRMGQLNREQQNVLYVNADVPESPTKSNFWTLGRVLKPLVAFLLLAGIFAVAIALPLTLSNNEDSSSFSVSETAARKEQLLAIVAAVSDPSTLNDTSSPQYAAVEWMASEDALSPLNSGTLSARETQLILQRYALAVFYYATTGDRWLSADGWLDGQLEECSWQFLECVDDDIVSIDTGARNNLDGPLPPELKELKELRSLILQANSISGLATEIAILQNLVELDLSTNLIGGTLPTEIFQLSTLRRLLLKENEFIGTISPLIANIPGLTELVLDQNAMTGLITNELLALTRLTYLDLGNNAFSGDFNTMLRGLNQLEALILVNSQISGLLSPDIQSFQNLVILDLAQTGISGSIPTQIGTLTNLRSLLLETLGLTGTIPTELGNLLALEYLYLDFNALTGPVPTEICSLPNLDDISVDCFNECQCEACGDACRR